MVIMPNPRRLRQLAWLVNGLLALTLAYVVVSLAATPLAGLDAQGLGASSRISLASSQPAELPPLSHYAPLWQRPLHGPLFDPPPVAPKPVVVVKPTLAARLVGTVMDEPDNSYGIFSVPGVGMKMVRPGEKVAEALVKRITEQSVEVEFAGEVITLKLEKAQ